MATVVIFCYERQVTFLILVKTLYLKTCSQYVTITIYVIATIFISLLTQYYERIFTSLIVHKNKPPFNKPLFKFYFRYFEVNASFF